MEDDSLQANNIKELEKGRAFIDKVRKKNGGLTKAQRERLQREDPEILESFDNLRSQLSSSTQLLAEQLYTKPTRFVYELIQNAEDNRYEKTNELPWLAFTLKEDKVIIDSNEDGFTEEDISAICAIAKSTKSTRPGYIGEKGIGFKSVFNVAQKVHVQSGPYSFAFEYRKSDKDDNGLGMVTPLNEDANKLPERVRTRTILYLLENYDREQLLQELLGLPDTLLLFLTKLRRLTLRFKVPAQDITEIQYLMPSHVDSDPANITRIIKTTSGKNSSEVVRRFYVQRHHVSNMPADPARKMVHEAEVVLGFPLDESNTPIIEDQHVFAYLPLKKAGYTFLIQSDFITQANREDLADSAWNRRLIGEVAETFCSAVIDPKGFLNHSRLRHSWVRFLPTSHVADEFWGRLKANIITMMREKPVFYSADESQWLPSSLRIVGSKFRDEDDEPLLRDHKGLADAYISRSYDTADDLPVLQRAHQKQPTDTSAVFRIYSRLQRYSDATDVSSIRTTFNDDLVLLPPGDGRSVCCWTSVQHVLWDGPDWYTYMTCLRSFNEYRSLQSLFTEVLALKDASIPQFLDFLCEISRGGSSSPNLDKVTSLYDKLGEASGENNASSPEAVRLRVEQEKLVYYPGSKTWHAPSSCIWAPAKVQLPGKVSLATAYTKQRRFFEDVLEIPKPSVHMHIAALQDRARTHPNKAAIFHEMQNICAFSPSADLLRDKLADCTCFPIRRPSGKIDWMASAEGFAIADRKEYASIFRDKIDILDFSLDEIHAVRAVLSALGLERQFMSKAVREETKVKDGMPLDSLTADLRSKAYAICRFAVHLGSSTARAAFSKLQALEVFTSDGISKSVSITQNGRSRSVQVSTAYFHVVQTEDRFKLYVPEELRRRHVCLARQLPIKMLESLGVPDLTLGVGLGSIITASSLFVVDAILDEDGIISLPDLGRPEEESQDAPSTVSSFAGIASPDSSDASANRITPGRSPTLESHNVSEIEVEPEVIGSQPSSVSTYRTAGPHAQYSQARITPIRAPSINEVDSSQPPSEPIPATPQPEEPELYEDLLDAVINQAASLGGLPVAGHHLISTDPAQLWIDTSVAVRSMDPGDYLNKIGAAGELFVFELLRSLDLPDFGRAQWRSTIRHRVRVHGLYCNLRQWTGSETADIVYRDRQLKLTEILIENGYLFPTSGQPPFSIPESVADSASWERRRPKYYIEVKTTPGPLDAPFFCSEGQVQRMEDMKFRNALPSKIYLIARVFGLGSSGMGVKLYVDPATMREHGRLNFRGGKYTVTPG
ncbi:hypothetical protein NA57DRAFT_80394 [Rhizodiscina lignyota]|uniref:Sacsin/Nov domain-containing protein n=1 Tax=Rhizodiscina lignyota TaxID=1504668 RepID=A0A9P4I430_9PEZI|nr:hypothetical protein NA57DRAFT_80394 [Rhizodiscina lignyota]